MLLILKHFKLFALDDDVLGYDTIGKTKRQSLDSTSDFVKNKLYYGKDKKKCELCMQKIKLIKQSNRSTFFCKSCQK
mgnify:CR=1 FL=1